jgi:dihydrofolate reductase
LRRVRYHVAASLDGFIAGPQGEFDWITPDPEVNFAELFSQFDTFVMGRRTFELVLSRGRESLVSFKRVIVASRTLAERDYPHTTVVGEGIERVVASLKHEAGKDIWLFGGGALFRSLLDAGLVDSIEIALIPVLLGGGISVLAPGQRSPKLRLATSRALSSGTVMLAYELAEKQL